jgi:hypothetical protein
MPFLEQIRALLVVCVAAGMISGFFLAIYLVKPMPIGWDTATYLAQANLVAEHGLSDTGDLVLPRPKKLLESRVGFPVTVLTLSSLTGASTFKFAAVVPVAAVVGVALAGGAFVSYGLRRGVWDLAAVALVVGTSTSLVRLIGGTYTDNLLAEAVFAGALIPLLTVLRDGRGFSAAILLLAVGGLAHPAFYGFMLAVLGLVMVIYVPSSVRAWRRRGVRLSATPAARLAAVLGGSASVTAFGIYGLLGSAPDAPGLSRKEFVGKLREDLPLYRLAFTAPVAAVGLGDLAHAALRRSRPRSAGQERSARAPNGSDGFPDRFVLTIMLSWIVVAAIGILGFYLGKKWPAHRFLAFLLPFPILLALAVLSAGRLVRARGFVVLGAAVAILGVAGFGYLGYRTYRTLDHRNLEYIDVGKVTETLTAVAYLDRTGVPLDAPVVFVITDIGPHPQLIVPEQAHVVRSVLPAARIPHVYFYVGTPENYLAGRLTLIPGDTRGFNKVSTRFWQSVEPVVPQRPVALLLSSLNPAFKDVSLAHPEWVVAQNIVALNGPRPAQQIEVAPHPTAPRGPVQILIFGAGTLAILTLIGLGWVVALMPGGLRPFEVLSLAIPFGIAALILSGTLVDRAGIRLSGTGGALVPVLTAMIGLICGARRLRRQGLSWFGH